jgi:hypothetical protein
MQLPAQEELQVLRKGLRKQKPPKVFDGIWGSAFVGLTRARLAVSVIRKLADLPVQ